MTRIYRWLGYWGSTVFKERRDPSTVILKEGQFERLLHDLRWFLGAKVFADSVLEPVAAARIQGHLIAHRDPAEAVRLAGHLAGKGLT